MMWKIGMLGDMHYNANIIYEDDEETRAEIQSVLNKAQGISY